MKPLLLLLFLCPQDSDVERLVEALSADSIEAREDAMEALARLSPDRLPALERHLAGAPAELRSRLEIAAGRILGSTLGPRALRME